MVSHRGVVPIVARIVAGLSAMVTVITLGGCPAPDPPKAVAPPPPSDAEAKADLERARAVGTADALIEVYQRHPQFPAGKAALRQAVVILIGNVKTLAANCDQAAARGGLARIAPFTLDDVEINERYDQTLKELERNEERCVLVNLDKDVEQLEQKGDWPAVFERIASVKEADGAALQKRRVAAIARWKAFLDANVREIATKRSRVDPELRAKLEAAVDPTRMPPELEEDLAKWTPGVRAAMVLFADMTDAELLQPPKKYWVYGLAHARRIEAPRASDGPTLAHGAPFVAVAKGKLGGDVLLLAGIHKTDLIARLQSSMLFVPEVEAKPYDTKKNGDK